MKHQHLRRLLFLLCMPFCFVFGQQDPHFTHYMYNTQAVNPAYAGSRDALTVTALYRTQWLNFTGAPVTQTITMHTPLISRHFGIGLALSNDVIAKSRTTNGQFDFAFRFSTGRRSQLALGMKVILSQFSESLTELALPIPTDDAFAENFRSKLLPNVGTGAYFQHERFYIGLSIPELLENQLLTGLVQGNISGLKKRHSYGIVGAILDLKNRAQLKPTALVKYTANAPIQIDVTARLIFRDKLITGLMYRYNAAAGLLLGFNFTEQLTIGYSFDWSFPNQTLRYNNGSHEFVLRYDFLYRHSEGVRSSRYF